MSYTLINQSPLRPMVREYVVDIFDDIATIKNQDQLLPGSIVFVIETGDCYILSHKRQWVKISSGNGSGDGGDSDSNENRVDYAIVGTAKAG